MVVFVVFEGDPISTQQEAVGQPAVTEIDLGTFLELVFAAADHEELVEGVLLPWAIEVVGKGFDLFFACFLDHVDLLLPDGRSVDVVFQL